MKRIIITFTIIVVVVIVASNMILRYKEEPKEKARRVETTAAKESTKERISDVYPPRPNSIPVSVPEAKVKTQNKESRAVGLDIPNLDSPKTNTQQAETPATAPIDVEMAISNPPTVGESATITLSVTPLVDGPWMEVSFKVPDGIEVINATGTRHVIPEIRQPPSLSVRQNVSMKAHETKKFEITIRVLREGRFVISSAASILDPASEGYYRVSTGSAIVLDISKTQTLINPPPPELAPSRNGLRGTPFTSDEISSPLQNRN